EKKKAENEKQIGRFESSMAEFRKKHNLDDLTAIEKDIEKSESEGERIDSEIHKLVEEKQNLLREKDRLEIQIDGMDKQIEKVGIIEKEHETEITALKKMKDEFKESVLRLNSMLTEASSVSARLADAKERGRGLEDTLGRLRVKAAGAKESALGDIAVTKILEQKNKMPEIFGSVSQLGKAPSRFSLALEIAAGQRIKNIVVESDETAAKCIDFLSRNRFGVATFLPMNKIKSVKIDDDVKELLKISGVHGFAAELIEHDAKYNRIFSYVFSDTIVVESIDVARRIGIGKARMVSLSGDLAEKSGAMTGGFRSREHRIGFSEKESSEELDKIEKQFAENSALQESLESQKKKSEDAIAELRVKKSTLEGDITKIERGLHLESNDLDASKREKQLLRESAKKTEEKLKEQEKLILSESKKLGEIKGKKQEMRIRISQLRDPSIIAELTAFEQKKQELSNDNAGIDANVLGLKKQIEMVLFDAEKALKILKQVEKEKGEFSEDIKNLESQTKEKTVILKEKEALQKSFLAKFKKSFDERQKLNDEITRSEAEIMIKEEKERTIEQQTNNNSLKKAEISGELAGLEKDFEPFKNVVLMKSKSEAELRFEIEKFGQLISEMGNINLKALEVYDSVNAQYNDMLQKKDTLKREKEDVLLMMHEIEGKKKGLFMKTFEELNSHFRKFFSALTTKADAFLQIENPEN
ncbi:MAG: hypothetical protein NTV63_05885, partial [Candidatus Woesearchaeota archaeon]|nr:hypothetical protein [Candidatus Woesearchaeota archaeon]